MDQGMVADCVAPGLCPPSIYDHMAQTSVVKGFNHSISTAVPAISLYMTAGRAPFTGSLTAHEGAAPPFMADVARLYASKLKDALVSAASGWLFGKSRNRDTDHSKMKPKIEPATLLPYRWSLPDKPRVGLSISMASGRRLAAITDDLGRVTLLDVQKGIAVRMWKGYRDADCGWVEVEGEWGGRKRWVTFLLIYAPRRGLLEVWMPQQGPRVAAFNVPKHSRLLYTPHTLLGANSVRGVRCKVLPVIFVAPDGTMSEVTIPFHLALGGKTSKRARDLHLLKTLKSHIKGGNEAEVLKVMSEIKTMAARKQAVATLVLSQRLTVSLLQGVLDLFLPIYSVEEEVEAREDIYTLDHESRLFGQQLVRLRQLVGLYQVLSQLHGARESSPNPEDDVLVFELSKILVLTPDETTELTTSCGCNEHSKAWNTKKVTFSAKEMMLSVGSFIRCWDVTVGVLARDRGTLALPIDLKEDIQVEKKIRLGELLYGWKWHRESIRKFHQAVEASGANPESLLHLALEHWAQGSIPDTVAILHFGMVLHTLSSIAESKILCEVSEQSAWWTAVRDKLVASEQPYHAYLAALLCRGVHATLESKAHRNKDSENISTGSSEQGDEEEDGAQVTGKMMSLNDWEGLSMEMVEWNLVLWQLGCLLPLSRLSSRLPSNGPEKQLKLEVSVKSLLDKGKGYVAELVANWFIASGIPLSSIKNILTRHDEQQMKKQQMDMEVDEVVEKVPGVSDDVTSCEDETEDELGSHTEIFDLLEKVGDKFPHSVAGDSVLTNMAWELAAAWHKNPDEVAKLPQAVAHIAEIKNSHIRHGVSVMIWETWVSRIIQSALGMVEKVGRLPKDRLCRRDLGLGEHCLSQMFKAASGLLEQVLEKVLSKKCVGASCKEERNGECSRGRPLKEFLLGTGANVVCEVEKPLVLSPDRFWSGQEGSPSLVELTIMQKMTCYDLVYHHHQLLSVLLFIAHHNLKNMKPLSCFDGKGRSVFFKPLSTSWTFEGQADPSVSKARTSLMCKVITTTVNAQPDNTGSSKGIAPSVRQALDLSRGWNMVVDPLYRQYICELYSSGFDKQAEEIIPLVSDRALLGSQLVLLCGQRLHHHLATSTRAAHHQALTSPAITEWLRSLESESLRCPGVSLNQSLELLNHALHLLAEGTQEYRMATALHQTFSAFIQDEEEDIPT
ncbi:Rab3 GTPase-activating protein non-catalytic subunit [Chionoecetes opilio]|uniref:Rab3 GTPase-activating protein non-catalytic subunit n=1 Tax=Chionoecetes opilio TaxID=41210 RepID=A0A8J5CKM6_CHIOP|nr:Rab3 GTPase-activating protein non-catalytic subunit [Chionoecetes opilio]